MGLFGTNWGPDIKINPGEPLNPVKINGETPGQILGIEPKNPPEPGKIPMPADLQGLISGYQKRAGSTPGDYSKQLMNGVSGAGAAIGFDPTSHALNARSQRAFQTSSGDLQRQADLQGYQTQIPRMARANELDQTLLNISRGVDSKLQNARLEADITRSQVLGQTIKGIGGAIGSGMAIAQNRAKNNQPSSFQADPYFSNSNFTPQAPSSGVGEYGATDYGNMYNA